MDFCSRGSCLFFFTLHVTTVIFDNEAAPLSDY